MTQTQWSTCRDKFLVYRLLVAIFHGNWLIYTGHLHWSGSTAHDGSKRHFQMLFFYFTFWQLFFINIYCVSSFAACLIERVRHGRLRVGGSFRVLGGAEIFEFIFSPLKTPSAVLFLKF